MKILILLLSLLAVSARAEYPASPGGECREQTVIPDGEANGVIVRRGLRCHSLYADSQWIELEVASLAPEKEFYFYDRNETYEFERRRKGIFVASATELAWRDGGVLYLGPAGEGRDRFLVSLVSVRRASPPEPVEIYIKQAGRELRARAIFVN